MRLLATLLFLLALAAPATAAVVHDEAVNGDLSTNPAVPTPIDFPGISNVINGATRTVGTTTDRDYITFTLAPDRALSGLNLLGLDPNNIVFMALNAGPTSWVPSAATAANFLSGIHVAADYVGLNLMPFFVNEPVTPNHLAAPFLGPGTYCFEIQQANTVLSTYSLEFVVDFVLPAKSDTWGAIKALYR